jgi:hypothetical protein
VVNCYSFERSDKGLELWNLGGKILPIGAGSVLRRGAPWDLASFTCSDAQSTALTPRGGDNAYYAASVNNRLNKRGDDGVVGCRYHG